MALTLLGLSRNKPLKTLPVGIALAALLGCVLGCCWAASVDGAEAKSAEAAQLSIKVDQVGYPLDGPKVALVSAPATSALKCAARRTMRWFSVASWVRPSSMN
jgi:hypothetical protein